MRKFLFVVPNSQWFDSPRWDLYPYNVCLLAAILRSDYKVEILDCNVDNLPLETAVKQISGKMPDYVGISCLAVEYSKHAHALAEGVKTNLTETPIILGGVYCTLLPEHAMRNDSIDFCVIGEGEVALRQLLEYLEQNILPENMDGVAFRKNGKLIIKPQREFIQDLDALPLPAFDLINFHKYCWAEEKFSFTDTRDALPVCKMYTSRGCPVGCNFCAVEHISSKQFRFRSVENILDEIQFMIDTFGVKEIVFYDDNLILDKSRAKELFRGMIDRNFNIKFKPANIAVYSLDRELLELMKEAGCTMLVFAIESASNRVLQEIMGKKPMQIEKVQGIVEYAKELGFRCAALFVIGNPGETWDEIRQTFAYAENLEVYCHFSIATPLPKTRLYQMALHRNCLTEDFSFDASAGCSRGWLVTDEFCPFDLEVLRAYEWDRINFSTPAKRANSANFFKVSEEEILEFARNGRKIVQLRYVSEKYKRI